MKQLAISHEITCYQPASLKSADAQAELMAIDADIMVVVAYGLILPKAISISSVGMYQRAWLAVAPLAWRSTHTASDMGW